MTTVATLRIKQVRSGFGRTHSQRAALQTLGLRRIGQMVERPDSPSLRGMLKTVGHLVSFEEVAEAPAKATRCASRRRKKSEES